MDTHAALEAEIKSYLCNVKRFKCLVDEHKEDLDFIRMIHKHFENLEAIGDELQERKQQAQLNDVIKCLKRSD